MTLLTEIVYPTPLAVSPLLPLLLISLSRQKHTPDTATRVHSEYDYVIVGSGSSGSVMAGRLSEIPWVSVLLLEAGKSPPKLTEVPAVSRSFVLSDIDWQYLTAPQKYTAAGLVNRQLVWPSGKTVGGSSVINAMFAVRGNRKNYDDWAAQGAVGWSYKEVLPYFIKMEDNRDPEYVANGFHGVGGPVTVQRHAYQAEIRQPLLDAATAIGYEILDSNGPRQTGIFDFQTTTRGGQRCSTAKSYLVPAENRTNLDILPNAFVRKIVIRERRATGVQFDYNGKTYEVRARKEVILSAGCTNSAQLLMLSGIGPSKELQKFQIPVVADLPVGLNLQDHLGSPVVFSLSSSTNIKPFLLRLLDQKNVLQYITSRTGPLASAEGCAVMGLLQNRAIRPVVDIPDHQIYFIEIPALIFKTQTGVKTEVFNQIYTPYLLRTTFTCVSQILHPKSRGTVQLKSTNPYDPPIIDPNYFENPQDLEDVVQGMKACLKLGTSELMRRLGSEPFATVVPGCEHFAMYDEDYLRCVARSLVITLNHQVGTAKMGDPKDPTTVVDPQLRVKTIDGLRVVDASIMPLIPSGNTNLPSMMIAEKAADMIKSIILWERIINEHSSHPGANHIDVSNGHQHDSENVHQYGIPNLNRQLFTTVK